VAYAKALIVGFAAAFLACAIWVVATGRLEVAHQVITLDRE
jgi:hypothetical protein